MEPWTIGLVAVIVLGVAVILYGALRDRARNRRAEVEMLSPPQRVIPQFRPDSPPPAYLSELQARRKPEDAPSTALNASQREELTAQRKDPSTLTVDVGYLSRDFATDPSGPMAVLDGPRVLVCSDPVGSTRELLPILERCALSQTPLVVVAPELSSEVRSTLEVNTIQHTMRVLAVCPTSAADTERIARATGAQIRSHSDLQAGYAWAEHLGTCARWVSTAKTSSVIGPVAPASEPR